jgi:hypothetical protein
VALNGTMIVVSIGDSAWPLKKIIFKFSKNIRQTPNKGLSFAIQKRDYVGDFDCKCHCGKKNG